MNFKNDVISSSVKKPSFTWYWTDYMSQQPKRSVSLLTLFVVIISTFVLAFLLFKNFDTISSWFSSSIQESTGFQIWQEVSLSGELQANGDLISYTHTLTMADASIVGLKSRTIDLGVYTGNVDIQGTIEKQFNDMYIVEVTFASWNLLGSWMTWASLWSGSWIYFAQAWIYLPAEFGQKYAVLNQWENGMLKVQNIATNQIILISYFACKATDPNKNCKQLQQNIWASAEKTVSTSNGDKLYKLEWVTSWFFTNNNLYGYFINDVSDQEVIDVANAFVLPSESYVKNNLLSKLQTLCTDGSTSLTQVTTYSLGMDLNGLIMNLEWPTTDWSAICKVFIDPSQAAWWSKLSYISNTPTTTDTTSVAPLPTPSIDTSVKQFPINLEKTMTFSSSSKWYSIIFPSSNIAYEAINVDESLDLPGVRCSTQMNVIKYSDKDMLNDNPTVKIFTCSIKWTLNNLWNTLIQKSSANGLQFLIQIMDPAWAEFAANIVIE